MKVSELEAGMLKLLKNVRLDAYERSHAEQEVRRAAYIVELASRTQGAILWVWRALKRAPAKHSKASVQPAGH